MKTKTQQIIIIIIVILIIVGLITFNQLHKQPRYGIYILENNELVLTENDISFYNKTCHEIKLTQTGIEKVKGLNIPLQGSPFVVRINEETIYNGSFVNPVSSIPPPKSAVIITTLIHDKNIIKIENGNLRQNYDPRENSKLFDYLKKINKLTQ